MEQENFWVTLLLDLSNGMIIKSDNASERFLIRPLLEVCKIVRILPVIVILIEFLKYYKISRSSFLIGYGFMFEKLHKKKLELPQTWKLKNVHPFESFWSVPWLPGCLW
jgi:hypothetical protein